MTHLYLIRHARSTWNAEGRVQGQADPPLDEVGRRQAQAVAARLGSETFDALYSSPLVRARETAEAIARRCRLIVKYDKRLMEWHMGEWSGLTGAEIEAWRAAHPDHRRSDGPPGGESRAALMTRAAAIFADIHAAYPDDHRVAVVGHGGLFSAYITCLLNLPPESPVSFHSNNTAIARLRVRDGQVAILALNDDRHLDGILWLKGNEK
jgi:broad specificity phosphatase PhoE